MIVPKYKIHVLEESHIYVFYGYYHSSMEELQEKFENPTDNVFNKAYNNSDDFEPDDFIFSPEELSLIQEKHISVTFVDFLINMDDTIQNIKNKIFLVTGKFPVEEMYLMSKDYKTLGQDTPLPNPFEPDATITFPLTVNNKCITATQDDTIYLCYAQHVVDTNPDLKGYLMETYYPLAKDREQMMKENRETIPELATFYKSVDMFYDVYQNRKRNLNYILPLFSYKQFDFTDERVPLKVPLQSIFNISHATETIPLIKYTIPKSTNVFRLYASRTSMDGRKIPELPFSAITKINSHIEKQSSVCFFVKKDYNMLFQLMETGKMRIFMEFSEFLEEEQCMEYMRDGIREVFAPLESFFKKSRIIPPDVEWKDIRFTSLEYQTKLRERVFDIKNIESCVSKIFIVENVKPNNISLRYKRISNFNVQNSKEAFVLNNEKQGAMKKNIITGLMSNYQMTNADASSFYSAFVSQMKMREKVKKRDYAINDSGILINIEINKLENNISIKSKEVYRVQTILPLFMIIDSIIRIRKDEDSTNYPIENINAICSIQIKEPVIKPEKESSLVEMELDEDIGEDMGEDMGEDIGEHISEDNDQDIGKDMDEEMREGEEKMEDKELTKTKTANLLNFLDSDSDDESETNGGKGAESGAKGGSKEDVRRELLENHEHVEGLNGLSLNNYFKKRMEEYDNKLFVNDKPDGKYKGYSSNCQSNVRRQPVILNKPELDNINETHPGLLEKKDVLEYKTDKGEDLYYICPRYWCLLDDSVMTQEEVDSGQCGKVIPHGANSIPRGHYVYEFFHPDEHGTREKYIKHGPGIVTNKHKQSCLPCCFKKWDTPKQIKKINECRDKGFKIETNIESVSEEPEKEKAKPTEVIVKSPEKFPLDEYTWGYLPASIELFFGEFNIDCQISRTNTELKTNYTCILRHGVEPSKNKSFIACISDIKNMYNHNGKLKNEDHGVDVMIGDIIRALDLDTFISLQNGSLVDVFSRKRDVDFSKYKDSVIYKKLSPPEGDEQFSTICSAYENYIDFLQSDEYVDYTYTWDLITKPSDYIFKNGVNLLIFEIIEDSTNKIELICPTNHYSSNFFDVNKKSVIILKKEEYFEPLYLYKSMNQYKAEATAYFDTKRNSTLSQKFKDVLIKIVKHRLDNCKPLPSIPDVYHFAPPMQVFKLLNILKHIKHCEVVNQVVNLHGKVVGLSVKYKETIGFVPCFPSSIIPYSFVYPYDYVFITDYTWNSYHETIDFLTKLNEKEKTVLCGIKFQVVEEEHVVGFLTQTNQFVQIDPPINITQKVDIPVLESYNHFQVDKLTGEDTERIEYVDKIKTESEMENIFMSYFIYLLNETRFKDMKLQLMAIKDNPVMLDSTKVSNIEKILKEVEVDFVENFTEKDRKTTRECFIKDCKVIFPKINSIDGEDNEVKYYNKLATYISRYPSKQIWSENSYLIFNPTKLSIYGNELYIMQQFLTKEYFDDLTPAPKNTYNGYDNVEPSLKVDYDTTIELKKILNPDGVDFEEKTENMHSVRWKKCFPDAKEVYYVPIKEGTSLYEKNKHLISGTYYFALQLLKKRGDFSESNITQMLYEEYINIQMLEYLKKYYGVERLEEIIDTRNKPPIKDEYAKGFREYFEKIIDLLKIEGKNGLAKLQTQKKIHPQVVLNNMINDNNYFLTVVDLWLLCKHLGISVVFISSFHIKIMNEANKHSFTGNITDDDIVYILVPGLGENKIPIFKHIINGVCDMGEPISFIDFLFDHQIESKTEYKKQRNPDLPKRKMTVIDDNPKRKMTVIDDNPKRKMTVIDDNPDISVETDIPAMSVEVDIPIEPKRKAKQKMTIVDL